MTWRRANALCGSSSGKRQERPLNRRAEERTEHPKTERKRAGRRGNLNDDGDDRFGQREDARPLSRPRRNRRTMKQGGQQPDGDAFSAPQRSAGAAQRHQTGHERAGNQPARRQSRIREATVGKLIGQDPPMNGDERGSAQAGCHPEGAAKAIGSMDGWSVGEHQAILVDSSAAG